MLIAGMLNIFFALALNYTNYRWKLHALLARDKGGCRLNDAESGDARLCERETESQRVRATITS